MQHLAPSQRVLAVSMHLASSHMVFDVLGVAFRTGRDNSYNTTSGAVGTTGLPRRLARICVFICNGVDGATLTARRLRGRHTPVWSGMVMLVDEDVAIAEQYGASEKKKKDNSLLQLRAYSPLPRVAAEDASDRQSRHPVGQYHAALRRSAGSALQVRQRNTAPLLGGGHEMLCTNCLVARTGRKMADRRAENERRCCLVLVTVQ